MTREIKAKQTNKQTETVRGIGTRKTKNAREYDLPDVFDPPKNCQMGTLYVNFEDLGLKDWIIAPGKFGSNNLTGFALMPLIFIPVIFINTIFT